MAKRTSPVNKAVKRLEKSQSKARLSPELKSLLERADQASREFKYKEAVDIFKENLKWDSVAKKHSTLYHAAAQREHNSISDLE